ncbi:hypothetical protein [Nitrospirillum sp. BR 11828]|uniref:hypothetical protein n=1 Tax=Nitrospirillum sp. BR 11828 TaxID=3104325 RepID=UPI002ACAB449|nr:hypothetical protein [Nitrospirillum sp. BR 11828]MDZ5648084.1 hypothetical protein [Nitrospirillum sp. BR 11828]
MHIILNNLYCKMFFLNKIKTLFKKTIPLLEKVLQSKKETVAMISAISSAASAFFAWKSADISNRSFLQTQRPWISVEVSIGDKGIIINNDIMSVDLKFTLKNVGNVPALYSGINAAPEIGITSDKRIENLERKCQSKNIKHNQVDTIFPNEIREYDIIYTVLEKEKANNIMKSGMPYIGITLTGCATYASPNEEGKLHSSRFIYEIHQRYENGGTYQVKIPRNGEPIGGKNIVFDKWMEPGSFKAD